VSVVKKKSFKDEISEGIKEFSLEQKVRLAVVSGIRALPFIGINGQFEFWKKERNQMYLFAVFHALDCGYYFCKEIDRDRGSFYRYASRASVADYAYAAAYAAAEADAYANDDAISAAAAAVNAAAAAHAAANSVYSVYADANAAAAVNADADTNVAATAYAAAAHAAIKAANAARADATTKYRTNFRSKMKTIIKNDIKTIGAKQPIENTDTEFYGEVWTSFQTALRDCGCDYWADLYQDLFRNHFEFDIPELERRLDIWDRYKDYGAAAAGEHLQSTRDTINVKVVKEARIIFIGKAGAGKTSLARKLVDPEAEMPSVRDETHGVDIMRLQLGEVEAHIWDFGGQAVIYSAHKCFLASRCVYIIVCDGRTEGTKEADIAKDFENIKHYGGESKVFVVVNKYSNHKVNFNEQFFQEQYPDLYVRHYEIDIQEDKVAVKQLKYDLERYIAEKPTWGDEINAKFYEVQERIKQRFQKGEDYITVEDMRTLADQAEISNADFPFLLRELHIIGSGLHYEQLERFKTIVLNPTWISHGVYMVIRWLYDNRKKVLCISDFSQIFTDTTQQKDNQLIYPPEKYIYIFNLMKEYKLGCAQSDEEMIVPCTLEVVSANFSAIIKDADCLSFRVAREMPLPENFMPQLITSLYEDFKTGDSQPGVWRNAFLYVDQSVHLLAFMNPMLSNSIEVSTWGKKAEFYLGKASQIFKATSMEYRYDFQKEEVAIKYDGDYRSVAILQKDVNKNDAAANQANVTYNQTINNITGSGNQILTGNDNTVTNNFVTNYNQASSELLEQLNLLSNKLKVQDKQDEYMQVREVIQILEDNQECKSKEEAKKKGVTGTVTEFIEQLGDDKSKLNKTLTGLERAGKIGKAAFDLGRKVAPYVPALLALGNNLLQTLT
jgi:GTPase SAR1 family protein